MRAFPYLSNEINGAVTDERRELEVNSEDPLVCVGVALRLERRGADEELIARSSAVLSLPMADVYHTNCGELQEFLKIHLSLLITFFVH